MDYHNLRLHFEGEGNVLHVRITQAEAIYKTLHYRQEHSMKFSAFLGRMQVMFSDLQAREWKNSRNQQKILFSYWDRVQAPKPPGRSHQSTIPAYNGKLWLMQLPRNSLMSTLARSPDYMQSEGKNIAATTMGVNHKIQGPGFPNMADRRG